MQSQSHRGGDDCGQQMNVQNCGFPVGKGSKGGLRVGGLSVNGNNLKFLSRAALFFRNTAQPEQEEQRSGFIVLGVCVVMLSELDEISLAISAKSRPTLDEQDCLGFVAEASLKTFF